MGLTDAQRARRRGRQAVNISCLGECLQSADLASACFSPLCGLGSLREGCVCDSPRSTLMLDIRGPIWLSSPAEWNSGEACILFIYKHYVYVPRIHSFKIRGLFTSIRKPGV